MDEITDKKRHELAEKCFLAMLSQTPSTDDTRSFTNFAQEAYAAADFFMLEKRIRKGSEKKKK